MGDRLEPIQIGEAAPAFSAIEPGGNEIRLADLVAAGPVVLVFFPSAFSRICSAEICEIREGFADVPDDEIAHRVLGVTTDSRYALRAWVAQNSIRFPVVSDFWPHGEIAKRYGVFDPVAGAPLRATFIIDADGIVRWRVVNESPNARDHSPYRSVLTQLLGESAAT